MKRICNTTWGQVNNLFFFSFFSQLFPEKTIWTDKCKCYCYDFSRIEDWKYVWTNKHRAIALRDLGGKCIISTVSLLLFFEQTNTELERVSKQISVLHISFKVPVSTKLSPFYSMWYLHVLHMLMQKLLQ